MPVGQGEVVASLMSLEVGSMDLPRQNFQPQNIRI